MNYDDADCGGVREWVLQSAEGWIRDFHFDGLRLDAIHAILDGGAVHLVQALSARVHALDPRALVIAESGMNDPKVVRSHERGGWGCDAVWADDFHHALRVLLTGDRDGYYAEFGELGDLAKAYRRPHVHDGNYSTLPRPALRRARRRRRRPSASSSSTRTTTRSATARSATGCRPRRARSAPCARCCRRSRRCSSRARSTASTAPFLFFADHIDEEIVVATREGRRREFAAFAEFAARRCPTRRTRRRSSAPSSRARASPRGCATSTRACSRRAARSARARRTPTSTSTRAGCACAAASTSCSPTSRRTTVHVPVDRAVELELATHHATVEPGYVVLPPLAGALVR